MDDDMLDTLIRSGDADTPTLEAHAVRRILRSARVSAQKPKPSSRRLLIPALAVAGLAALTGGAAALVPYFTPTVTIPIEYTASSGEEVSCSIYLEVGSEAHSSTPELRDWVRNHDWSGLGRQIHRLALLNSQSPQTTPSSDLIDEKTAWAAAARELIETDLPDDLQEGNTDTTSTSDCSGVL